MIFREIDITEETRNELLKDVPPEDLKAYRTPCRLEFIHSMKAGIVLAVGERLKEGPPIDDDDAHAISTFFFDGEKMGLIQMGVVQKNVKHPDLKNLIFFRSSQAESIIGALKARYGLCATIIDHREHDKENKRKG